MTKHVAGLNVKTYCRLLLALFLISGSAGASYGKELKVDINELIKETQKMSSSPDVMSMVWWIPEEFWLANFAADPNSTEQQAEEFLKVLRPYTVMCVAEGRIGAFGGITYDTEAFLRENILIIADNGTRYTPIANDELDADTKNLLAAMKPVLVNTLGPMGENMHFYLFPSKNEKGKTIVNAKQEGAFTVKVKNNDYRWRLPLSSLVPRKKCPVDGEMLNGAWKYCPWHGKKLEN